VSGGGECPACRQRRQALRRRAADNTAVAEVPAIVTEVVRSSGKPLDTAMRSFFEPRFGRDFSRVRVHTDARAAESAHAVAALAYTVGQHIGFASGQYAPATVEGRLLLAHELTHVVQQGPLENDSLAGLYLDGPGTREREAEAVAARVLRGEPAGPITPAGTPVLQTQTGSSSSSPPDQGVCGPNLTAPTRGAVGAARTAFKGWSNDQRADACFNLRNMNQFPGKERRGQDGSYVPIASISWDIPELHHQEWLQDYRTDCATFCKTPTCGFFRGDPGWVDSGEKESKAIASVQIDGSCHYAGSVNYVIFGVMCRLCYDHYMALADAAHKDLEDTHFWQVFENQRLTHEMEDDVKEALRYDEGAVKEFIWEYKGHVPILHGESANYEASKRWAVAGYNDWPAAASTPAGDRPNCAVNVCSHTYGSVGRVKGNFHVNWYPHGWSTADPALG
jgi:hypothetical protein